MKTTRIQEKIRECLNDGKKNSVELLDYLNSKLRHGSTMQQMGNVLDYMMDVEKLGRVYRNGVISGKYFIYEWTLKENLI